jgi:hypothetical protein
VTDDPTTLGTTEEERATARRLWIHLEVLHVTQYFSPAVREAHAALGLELPWGGYTAGRIACMGPGRPGGRDRGLLRLRAAAAPGALPAAWDRTTPERAHEATLAAVATTLEPLLGALRRRGRARRGAGS